MTYDTLTMAAVNTELQKLAVGARVQRISQPSREEIILSLYHEGKSAACCFHAIRSVSGPPDPERHRRRSSRPFLHAPAEAPTGSRISAISQPHLERILKLHFTAHEGLPA